MLRKTIILIIFSLLILDVSACSFKVSPDNNQTASNPAKVEEKDEALKKSALSDSDSSALSQTGNKTGTYKYKSSDAENEISVQETGGNKLRVGLYASYVYKVNGELNANVGEAKGIAALNGDTATLVPEDTEGCEITLKFSGSKIIVKVKNEFQCGFGLNVSANGTYTKTGSKPDFGDSDGNSNNALSPTQNSNGERISFAKGKSSATISGSISKTGEKTYLIGARAGQTLNIQITEGGKNNDVVFSLYAPDGTNLMGDEESGDGYDSGWKGNLPKTGDYKIVLGIIESENANFKMSVSIR